MPLVRRYVCQKSVCFLAKSASKLENKSKYAFMMKMCKKQDRLKFFLKLYETDSGFVRIRT